jgi:poly(glycerol-phosphate) alpha-glucosyltransferase
VNILCLMDSVSRANGGIFEAERRLQQSLAADCDVSIQVMGLQDHFAAEDGNAWRPLEPEVFRPIGPRGFGFSPALRSAVLKAEADLAYCAGLWKYHAVVSLQWARRTHKPLVVAPHGMLDPWALQQSRGRKRVARLLFQNAQLEIASCIRALCHAEARAIRKLGFISPIAIIPNGIDLPGAEEQGVRREADAREPLRRIKAAGRKVLLYLGRIHPKKGLVNLLRGWPLARGGRGSAARDWVLAIVGWDQDGHEAELKRLATQLGLGWADGSSSTETNFRSASVFFLGPQFGERKAACYRNCDAFVLPSLSEGVPMVVLEAWAYHKPVLITPECNLPEGFAANAAIRIETDTQSIMAGLARLFEMPGSEMRAMGAAGYQLAASSYAWPRVAEDMKCLCQWLLGGGAKPACLAE